MSHTPIYVVGAVALSFLAPIPATAHRVTEQVSFTRTSDAEPASIGGSRPGSPSDTVFRTSWLVSDAIVTVSEDTPHEYVPTITDPREEAIMERLAAVSLLDDGWNGKRSKAPNATLITWLSAHRDILAFAPHTVSVIPTSDGSLALQWGDDTRECTAELFADDRMQLYVDHLDSDEMDEASVSLDVATLQRFLSTSELA